MALKRTHGSRFDALLLDLSVLNRQYIVLKNQAPNFNYSGERKTMKVLVAVKRVVDYNVKVRPKSDMSDVELANVKMSINPFCEIAVEEAVRLKEKGIATEIIAVSIGAAQCQEQLRTALALGADRAILVQSDEVLEPLAIAKCLKAVCESESPDIILMGKQAIDGDNNQTGQMLAALAGYGQATFASELTIDGGSATVIREVDGGLQTVTVTLPAIVTADLRLNEPRYASLPNIMKAKKKQLDTTTPADLGVDVTPRVTLMGVELPAERSAGITVEDVTQLVDKLKNEAKVIS
ncbi:MAG: electron transfer flavoprotein beta subunit [Porticoccaceae bacterium]